MTQTKVMEQRLIRGTTVVVADSFGQPLLRGTKMIVASKGPVKCNGKGRCAGDWCLGLAVFLGEPDSNHDEKEMGWRSNTTKICLTHLKDEEGNLVLPPPAMRVAVDALAPRVESPANEPVSWEGLAQAVSEKDWTTLVILSRRLKRENEVLRQQVNTVQDELIVALKSKIAALNER